MTVGYELGRPFAFTKIQGSGLVVYRWVIPCIMVAGALTLYWALPAKVALVGENSASDLLLPLFASLPGFYIAALAAVATFNGVDLDREMDGVSIEMTIRGERSASLITLRVFLCYLFSYLTMLSFFGFSYCASGTLLAGNVREVAENYAQGGGLWLLVGAKSLFILALGLTAAKVVTCTALGLYFLSERVHQELN